MKIVDAVKGVLTVVQKSNDLGLQKQLLDVYQMALDLQDEITKLKAENAELRKGQDLESRIIRHEEPYITLQDETPEIRYCAICWGNNKKLIQMSNGHCFNCEATWRAVNH